MKCQKIAINKFIMSQSQQSFLQMTCFVTLKVYNVKILSLHLQYMQQGKAAKKVSFLLVNASDS